MRRHNVCLLIPRHSAAAATDSHRCSVITKLLTSTLTTFVVIVRGEGCKNQPSLAVAYDRRMARSVPVEDLVGAAEIAERLGLAHSQSVHKLRQRHRDFPEPVATLKVALIWDW